MIKLKVSRDFLRLYLIPIVLFIGILLATIFTIFYTTTTKTKDGKIVNSNWPKEFTLGFSQYITLTDQNVVINSVGEKQLQEHDLWIQVLNRDGKEIYQYQKPSIIPDSYNPYELLNLYQNGNSKYSVFVSNIRNDDSEYTYLIGFPLSISKVVAYVDTTRYNAGKILIIGTIILTGLILFILTVFYNMMITKNLEQICTSLKSVASRSYKANSNKRFLKQIYDGIDTLNHDIEKADIARKQDDKAKVEWLSNITHDLKTPLAPIRGYAELLVEDGNQFDERAKRYGEIILKDALYTEQLVDDLKLTYQLQSNMLPLKKNNQNISYFMKEMIIDLLNTPEYEERNISFTSEPEDINFQYDEGLIRRALTNIIINALKHNNKDTDIEVKLYYKNVLKITISDNGSGMTSQELDRLFNRYYRGTSTEIKAEGSGLGMAIAKQIVEAHNGQISAESVLGKGTTIIITLPL